jgi:nicotinic acetylcholine receptor, invertebrate
MHLLALNLFPLLFASTFGTLHSTLEGQIRNNLTRELLSNYNINVMPDLPVDISVSLGFYQLISLNERNQIMTINGYLEQIWTDYRFTWNPNNYGSIEYISIPSTMVWLPDTCLFNSASNRVLFSSEITPNLNVIVFFDGTVLLYLPMMNLESRCDINTRKFPFDKHICPIIIESWSFSENVIKYNNTVPEFHQESFTQDSVWLFKGATVNVSTTSYGYNRVYYLFEFERKPLYYLVNGIFPCFILNAVSIIAFLMAYDMQVTLSLTCFLTLTVNSVVILEDLPVQSDYLQLISLYLMASIFFPFISLFWFMYYDALSKKEQLPKWIQVIYTFSRTLRDKIRRKTKVTNLKDDEQKENQLKKQLSFINYLVFFLFIIVVLVSVLSIWLSFLD